MVVAEVPYQGGRSRTRSTRRNMRGGYCTPPCAKIAEGGRKRTKRTRRNMRGGQELPCMPHCARGTLGGRKRTRRTRRNMRGGKCPPHCYFTTD